ncbi:MAG: TetR/AcrR family transcriptional regulator [Clostridium sp.]
MNKTKKAIFEAAIKIFSSNGYDSATMDEVATTAGVAKGSLYYHFKSKEEIFYFVVQAGIDLISEEVNEAIKEIDDPIERLKEAAKVQLKYVYINKDLFRVIMSQVWGQKERHEEIRCQIKHLINMNSKFLEGTIENKNINNEDSGILSYCFIGVLFSSALYEIINNDNYNHDEVVEKFMNYINHGVRLT